MSTASIINDEDFYLSEDEEVHDEHEVHGERDFEQDESDDEDGQLFYNVHDLTIANREPLETQVEANAQVQANVVAEAVVDDEDSIGDEAERVPLNIIESQRPKKNNPEAKGKKLCHNGFYYTIATQTEHKTTWKCEKNWSLGCSARVYTTSMFTSGLTENNEEHNHEPLFELEQRYKLVNKIKNLAIETDEEARRLITNAVQEVSRSAASYIQTNKQLTDIIKKQRY